MYRLGHRYSRHYVLYSVLLGVILLAVAGVLIARYLFPADTHITQSPAVTHYVAASDTPVMHVSKSVFTLDLPSGWHEVAPLPVAYTMYSWAGGSDGKDAPRRLDVYVDKMPVSLAVNRLLPVQANADYIDAIGNTSDNCVNFTDKTPASNASGVAPSKWSGINFLCDVGNYERDVVATGSSEGINQVSPTGLTTGQHHILLLYTDNSGSPDYTIFLAIVRSFHLI